LQHLRINHVITETEKGITTTISDMTSDEEIVFTERNAVGFVMRWTTTAVTVKAQPPRQAVLEAVAKVAVNKPLLIQTDADGVPDTLLNAADTRATFTTVLDAVLATLDKQPDITSEAERQAVHKMLTGLLDTYRNASDAQLAQMMLEEPNVIYGLGGVPLAAGKSTPFHTMVALPLANTPLNIDGKVALRSANADEVVIAVTNATRPAEVKKAISEFLSKMAAEFAPEKQKGLTEAMAKIGDFDLRSELLITLDAKTGMLHGARGLKHLTAAGRVRDETKTFTPLD